MILQRNTKSNVWGTGASPGATVTVSLTETGAHCALEACVARTVATTRADDNGTWTAALAPTPATVSAMLKVTDGSTSATLSDVAVGDVLICGGQVCARMP